MKRPAERGDPIERTYVVFRWLRHAWADPPTEELAPLGTVRAATLARAKVLACAAWLGEPAAALRVRWAPACRPALLLQALAADGARDRGVRARHAIGTTKDGVHRRTVAVSRLGPRGTTPEPSEQALTGGDGPTVSVKGVRKVQLFARQPRAR